MTYSHPCLQGGLRASLMAVATIVPLHAQEPTFTLTPAADHRQLGARFAAISDLDGDGVTDFAVSDPYYRSGGTLLGSGIVHLISGADGGTIRSYEGAPAASQLFGFSLAALDADGDGITDLAVGAPGQADSYGQGAGAVWVYSGSDGTLLSYHPGGNRSQYGSALANAGDQDGDGLDDLFVGAPYANGYAGAVTVQSGLGGGAIRSLASDISFSSFGSSLAALADIDGDGRAELAVGAPGFRSGTSSVGRVSLIRSSDDAVVAERTGSGSYTRLGETLAMAADADGDGRPEVMVGSYSDGVALLLSGHDLSTVADLTIPSFPAYQPVHVGGSLDYDGDGIADFLIGSPGLNTMVSPAAGGIRIVSGADGSKLFERLATAPYTGLGLRPQVLPGYGFAAGEGSLAHPATGGRGLAMAWQVNEILDSDGDGIPDSEDAVPDSNTEPTVALFGIDSGVENRVDVAGMSLADRFAELGTPEDYRQPAHFMVAAIQLCDEIEATSLLTPSEAQLIKKAAQAVMKAAKRAR